MSASKENNSTDLYGILGLPKTASATEVRRAYRTLLSKVHPDKGGDAEKFKMIKMSYDTLSDEKKRRHYDTTGAVLKTVEEELMESFAGGAFKDLGRSIGEVAAQNMADQIVQRQETNQSHTAGFEAWMRSRGDAGVQVFSADDIADQYGVVKGSYDIVPLPRIKAHTVKCTKAGPPKETCVLDAEPIPTELSWGEVLISIRVAPMNPGDLYTLTTGGLYSSSEDSVQPPFVAGHDFVGQVVKVGPGVSKNLLENDWVVPNKPNLGSWRSLAVLREKDLMKIPTEIMPLEQCAMLREFITAWRLLEDFGTLKPGDAVILNAANSTIGTLIIQLGRLLKLRIVAVISERVDFEKTSQWLKALGASEVLLDKGSVKAELEKLKFFAKPKLGLDSIGGSSSVRLTEALSDGAQLVVYGCMSGKSPQWNWRTWVFESIGVSGFNVRKWMKEKKKKVPALLESIAKLVNAGKLQATFTEYELATEFEEALDHAMDRGKNTKVLLKVSDVGIQY